MSLNSGICGRNFESATAVTTSPRTAPPKTFMVWSVWPVSLICGPRCPNVCEAMMIEANVSRNPVTPKNPNPGSTRNSSSRHPTPIRNSTISSDPAVPPSTLLQKNRPKHTAEISPKIPVIVCSSR